jgi:hypothetical protein
MDLATQLYTDYCAYYSQTAQARKFRTTPVQNLDGERRLLMEEFIRWCDERCLPPREFLFVLFARRGWGYIVPLLKGHLCSDKGRKFYLESRDTLDFSIYERRISQEDKPTINDECMDEGAAIQPHIEHRKFMLARAGGFGACYDAPDETKGFHPKSGVCQTCPLAQACSARLQEGKSWDVAAYRKSVAEAQQVARWRD